MEATELAREIVSEGATVLLVLEAQLFLTWPDGADIWGSVRQCLGETALAICCAWGEACGVLGAEDETDVDAGDAVEIVTFVDWLFSLCVEPDDEAAISESFAANVWVAFVVTTFVARPAVIIALVQDIVVFVLDEDCADCARFSVNECLIQNVVVGFEERRKRGKVVEMVPADEAMSLGGADARGAEAEKLPVTLTVEDDRTGTD